MRPTTPTRPSWQTLLPILLIALAALALRWPVLELGMMSDDYAQHAMVAGLYPGTRPYAPLDLYAFFRNDAATLAAARRLTRTEGILPALESAHALAWVEAQAEALAAKRVVLNLSGRGDKDLGTLVGSGEVAP